MGIKINIKSSQLPKKYQDYNLIETTHGVKDSVYLLDDKYVLKVFEAIDEESIENEQKLLELLQILQVPSLVDIFDIDGNKAVVYTQVLGQSVDDIENIHLEQIGTFLKQLHNLTQHKSSSNIPLFERKRVYEMIVKTGNDILIKYFDTIDCRLKNNGIIHGDLFFDNAKFVDDKLSGVYDFSEACNGDFLFDLAVVAVDWCFDDETLNEQKLNTLMKSYDENIEIEELKEYMKYACLYYATTRYIAKRDFNQLINKLERL